MTDNGKLSASIMLPYSSCLDEMKHTLHPVRIRIFVVYDTAA